MIGAWYSTQLQSSFAIGESREGHAEKSWVKSPSNPRPLAQISSTLTICKSQVTMRMQFVK